MNNKLTVAIPTKDRPIEISLLLQSLLFQTYQEFDILIIDDCIDEILYTNTTIQYLIKLLKNSDHEVTIIKGPRKGPHICGQMILENSKTELILRLDDDISLRPQFIESLINVFKNDKNCKIGAVGPIYLNPHQDIIKQQINPNLTKNEIEELGKVKWDVNNQLFLTGYLQNVLHNDDELIKVEHLNSGFMYRKSAGIKIGGYCMDLSPVGHREESDFSYRIFKAGYELYVNPKSISFHGHPFYGGIRETNGQMLSKENWDHDEKIFLTRLEKLLPKNKEIENNRLVSVIILTHGLTNKNLKELLTGISKYTTHPSEYIIVNNDTRKKSLDNLMDIKDEFNNMNIKIISVEKELSVSEARNEGVKYSSEESKYICFIDDDARILGRYNQTTDWLDYLYNRFHEEPDVGAVGPIYTWFDELKTYSISLACLFTSKKVFEVVGGFDPVFGNKEKGTWGYEDCDWSYRCFSLGFKILGVKGREFPFYHEDTTFKEKPEWKEKGLIKSKELLFSKYNMNEINYFSNRTIYPFTPYQMDIHGIKLNVGCYYMYLDDFINIDIKSDINADLICNIKELDKHFQQNSVDLILASNVFEHLDSDEGKNTLKLWYSLLVENGTLIIEVPDNENLQEKLDNKQLTNQKIFTIINGCPDEFGQLHKSNYTRQSLYELLKNVGFKEIIENPNTSLGFKDSMCFRYDCKK